MIKKTFYRLESLHGCFMFYFHEILSCQMLWSQVTVIILLTLLVSPVPLSCMKGIMSWMDRSIHMWKRQELLYVCIHICVFFCIFICKSVCIYYWVRERESVCLNTWVVYIIMYMRDMKKCTLSVLIFDYFLQKTKWIFKILTWMIFHHHSNNRQTFYSPLKKGYS